MNRTRKLHMPLRICVSLIMGVLPCALPLYASQTSSEVAQAQLPELYESAFRSCHREFLKTLATASNECQKASSSLDAKKGQTPIKRQYLESIQEAAEKFLGKIAKLSQKPDTNNVNDIINLNERLCKNIAQTSFTGNMEPYGKTVQFYQQKLASNLARAARRFRNIATPGQGQPQSALSSYRAKIKAASSVYSQAATDAYMGFFKSIRLLSKTISDTSLVIALNTQTFSTPIKS